MFSFSYVRKYGKIFVLTYCKLESVSSKPNLYPYVIWQWTSKEVK